MPPCMAAVMVNAGRRSHENRNKDQDQRGKLRESLLNNAKKLSAKFREWDVDGDGFVDKEEFRSAVPKMGIPACKVSLLAAAHAATRRYRGLPAGPGLCKERPSPWMPKRGCGGALLLAQRRQCCRL